MKKITVHNPIIPGFHPDPSIICVDGTYYIANSTFEWFPGVELYRSRDLVNWYLDGHILTNPQDLDLRGVPNSGGVWAPCLSWDGGKFFLVFSITRTFEETVQDTDNYYIWAKDIHGPWSEPVYLNSGGFDASLFHDTDGRKWLVNMRWDGRPDKNHFPGIIVQELDGKTGMLTGKPEWIFKGTKRGLTEGPHIYKRDGYYYLMVAEGGTSEHHAVSMARSRSLSGPYEEYPDNPVLTSDGMPELDIQYAGHGDLICDAKGQWYLVHLGSRKKLFHGYSVMGRETFIQKVEWTEDGWLRLCNGTGHPDMEIDIVKEETSEEENAYVKSVMEKSERKAQEFYHMYTFDNKVLDPHFMSLRVPLTDKLMSLTERRGYLRLKGRESLYSHHEQCMAAVRIAESTFAAETCLSYYPEHQWHAAGLIFWYNTSNFYYVAVTADEKGNRMIQILARDSRKTRLPAGAGIMIPQEGDVCLRGEFSPEGILFFWRIVDKSEEVNLNGGKAESWIPVTLLPGEKLPVTILSDEYANTCGEQGFTGAFVGMCAQDMTGMGYPADFRSFSLIKK